MRRNPLTSWLAGFAILVLAFTTIQLARRLDTLAAAFDRLRLRSAAPEAGGFLPTFAAATVDGDSVVVGAPDRRQLVFVLSASCPYCRATLPSWKALTVWTARQVERPVEVIALSLDSLPAARAFARAERLSFPVALFPSRQVQRLSRAGRVPQTLVLGGGGLVLYARLGVLSDAAVDSVRRALRWERPLPADNVPAAVSSGVPATPSATQSTPTSRR